MTAWRDWTPGTRVEHRVSGWPGEVLAVDRRGNGCDRVKVRWVVSGHEGWIIPAQLVEVAEPATEVVVCNVAILGPKVGRRVVLYRNYCKRKVRVPVDAPARERRCWQHR